MKGLTHFVSGVAAATFIPQIARMSISSRMDVEGAASSFILVLAGMFGILPDTLDFKFGQFFESPDFIVDPDPLNTDPGPMAEAFAAAVKKAAETGKEVRIQYFPIQLAANRWRQYCIIFDRKEVSIQVNEIVSTSQIPVEGTAPAGRRTATAQLVRELKSKTDDIDWLNMLVRKIRGIVKRPDKCDDTGVVKPSTVDILSSTMFGLKLEKDGKIYFNWLPWHRTWSHSYVLGAFMSLFVFAAAYLLGLPYWWLYGSACFIGYAVHITEDMTGHIGGSLLWPFLRPRTEGLELFKASDPRTNFSVIYTALVLSVWNLDRFTTQYITGGPDSAMSGIVYLIYFIFIPMTVYFVSIALIKDYISRSCEKIDPEEDPDGTGEAVVD